MRVTGGTWRGRTIPVRHSPDTALRPTSDKMRQAIFNVLMHNPSCIAHLPDWPDVRVLDAFCGSGALGFEALSRGVSDCLFWDRDRHAISAVKQWLKRHHCDKGQAITLDALKPGKAHTPVDLVFLDPPYNEGMIDAVLPALHAHGWITDQTLCVCDVEGHAVISALSVLVDKPYGGSRLVIGHYK